MRSITFGAVLVLTLNAVTNAIPISSSHISLAPKTESSSLGDHAGSIPSSETRIEKRFMNEGELDGHGHLLEQRQHVQLAKTARKMANDYSAAALANQRNKEDASERASVDHPGDGAAMMRAEAPHEQARLRNVAASESMTRLGQCHDHIANAHGSHASAISIENSTGMRTQTSSQHRTTAANFTSAARLVCSEFPHLQVPN
ncbi:hypothetical protein FRC14_004489 [Serendipita sp. 396]|nr:hypothetical protein FRC14_004489 [Serendipita sp. 396]KAG8782016.1 hypothetical protein FRC15_007676 [Serendipita sp. 397]KAG8798172.1 hypothetical protein FRC16_007793 [Serendipita sp. 398]KAG8822591.1 hypothetical protein FRC19_005645 [Serendipita sp. 401]KAG8866579.1 hypothetical protein FRC20_008079 [Serendipita sp. 405]KAG9053814.1 hypothetical protein FS842_007052 [Serendipita sp. 407]